MSTKFSNRPVYEQSHEEHQAAGRMGGKARGNQRQHDDDSNNQPSKRSRSNSSQGNNGKMSRSEAGRKGGQTRAKNQGQGQYQQRGNDFDPESDKYGYDEGDFEDDSIAAHTRSHDQDNESNDNDYTEPNDEPEGRSSNRRGSKAHSDFEQGKNPNRQAVARRVARERGHDAFVEMGRKGGHGNAGIHADLDFDDMESFRSNPGMGVPAKNPNRVRGGKQAAEKRGHDELSEMGQKGGEMNAGRPKFGGTVDNGEDDSESFNMRDVKDPNRVSGGIRAANKQSHESFVERGKMGAEARWGNNRQSGGRGNQGNNGQNDDENDDDDQGDEQTYDGKNMNRVRGGQKAAQTRAEHGTQYRGGSRSSNQQGRGGQDDDDEEDDDSGMNDDDDQGGSQRGRGSSSRQQAGKKAAETRARNGTQYRGGSRPSNDSNRQSQGRRNQGNDEDDEDMDDDNDDDNGKDPTRVQAGKKAAETRARNGTQYRGGSRSSGGNSGNNSRGSGNGRGGNTNQGKSFEIEEDDDNYDDMNQDHFEDDQGKNPNRVRGGQKAASHFTHEELSERARRAAQTRAQNGTQSRNGSGISRNRQSQGGNNDDDMDYE